MLAVAWNHFPDVPEPFLKLLSARAMQSEGYLKNLEICVKRARFLAGEDGRAPLTLADVQAALDYTMSGTSKPSLGATKAMPEKAKKSPPRPPAPTPILPPIRRAVSRPAQVGLNNDFPRRETLPKVGAEEPCLAS